jgi:putative tryptophan/tyrosine transport system substrate-binding protein
VKALAELGWTDGRNLSMNVRCAAGNADRMRMFAKELVDLQPDLILANSTPVTASLQRETQTIPIVFVAVSDPVGSGFVTGLARPGGNITGFADAETAMMGKWLELLTAIAPSDLTSAFGTKGSLRALDHVCFRVNSGRRSCRNFRSRYDWGAVTLINHTASL